jgi:hypothetical protein
MPHVVGIRFQDDLNGPAAVRIDYNRAFEVQSALLHRLPDNAENIIAQGMAVLDLHLTQFLRREQRLIAGMQRKGIHGDKGQGGGGGTLQAEHIPVTAGEGEQQKGALLLKPKQAVGKGDHLVRRDLHGTKVFRFKLQGAASVQAFVSSGS